MNNCFYKTDSCSTKMSREHVISKSALISAFGNPIRSSSSGEFLNYKKLLNHEQTVKDVCVTCNSSLSQYDIAGAALVSELDLFYDPNGKTLSFTENTLGWLIKTHLNHLRIIRDSETNEIYQINDEIKSCLINKYSLPKEKFKFLYDGWEGAHYFWDAEHPKRLSYFGYRSVRFKRQKIILSDFRIKTLHTWLILPYDNDYNDFDSRVESVLNELFEKLGFVPTELNLTDVVNNGILEFEKIIPLEIVRKFIFKHPSSTEGK